MDNFTTHRLINEVVLRAQERASRQELSHTLPADPRRTSRPAPAARQAMNEWPNDEQIY